MQCFVVPDPGASDDKNLPSYTAEAKTVENSTQPVTQRKLPLFKDEWEYNNSIHGSRKQATEHDGC